MGTAKLPELVVTLNGVTYDNTFEDDIRVDRTNLDFEFEDQPRRYAFYAFLAGEARHIVNRKKAIMEQVYAAVDADKRMEQVQLLAAGSKQKPTETMYENMTKTDPRFKTAQEEYHLALRMADQLTEAAKAVAQRKDMLIQLGLSSRVGSMPTAVTAAQESHVKDLITRNRREDEASNMANTWTTGFVGSATSKIPGTAAFDLSAKLDSIKANIGFEKLQQLRDSSPTGGALGQVSERENQLLQSVWGSLLQSQSQQQFKDNLRKVKKQVRESWVRVERAYQQDFGDSSANLPSSSNQPTVGQPPADSGQGQVINWEDLP